MILDLYSLLLDANPSTRGNKSGIEQTFKQDALPSFTNAVALSLTIPTIFIFIFSKYVQNLSNKCSHKCPCQLATSRLSLDSSKKGSHSLSLGKPRAFHLTTFRLIPKPPPFLPSSPLPFELIPYLATLYTTEYSL